MRPSGGNFKCYFFALDSVGVSPLKLGVSHWQALQTPQLEPARMTSTPGISTRSRYVSRSGRTSHKASITMPTNSSTRSSQRWVCEREKRRTGSQASSGFKWLGRSLAARPFTYAASPLIFARRQINDLLNKCTKSVVGFILTKWKFNQRPTIIWK